MNILFRGPYRQNDGWGHASHKYLQTFLKSKHNIRAEFIQLGNNVNKDFNDQKVIEAEKGGLDFDVVVHYCLPQFVRPIDGLKNIIMFHYETEEPSESMREQLTKADGVIVSTLKERNYCLDINKNVFHIPVPVNKEEYAGLKKSKSKDDPYVFYFIGELAVRKNIQELLLTYIYEFSKNDNVKLIIKGNWKDEDFYQYYTSVASVCRKGDDYPPVVYTGNFLSRQDLLQLHVDSDCFISLSRGESICLPLVDAIYCQNQALVTAGTGMDNYLGNKNVHAVPSSLSPCFCPRPPLLDMYTSQDLWRCPHLYTAAGMMRDIYETRPQFQKPHDLHNEATIIQKFNEVINEVSNVV